MSARKVGDWTIERGATGAMFNWRVRDATSSYKSWLTRAAFASEEDAVAACKESDRLVMVLQTLENLLHEED